MSTSINISPTTMTAGTHLLAYYAVDRVGNTHNLKQVQVIKQIDFATLPVTSYYGINNNDRILTTKQYPNNYPNSNPPSIPFPNQLPVATRFQEIKEMGLNVIRINMYWEGYRWYKSQGKASTFLNRVKEIADTANSLGLGILYNVMHQWNISSVLYSSSTKRERGTGFPEEALKPLGLVRLPDSYISNQPIDGSTDVEKAPVNIFWKNFVNNYDITIDGITKPIWQHIWDGYYKDVVIATKDHPSTIGYEMMNEPFVGTSNVTATHFDGMGRYYSYISQKIRELTSTRKIFFAELLTFNFSGVGGKGKGSARTIPKDANGNIINDIVFTMNRYGQEGFTTNTVGTFDEIQPVMYSYKIPIVITEWNNQAQSNIEITLTGMKNYLQEMKSRGYGWFFFNYDPNFPWTIKDSNYNDKWNGSKTITFRQMLYDVKKQVYS
ncbi:MAG: cellulase family glycosylhydrolase [Candidatus Nitrosocaldaceae archaeon]